MIKILLAEDHQIVRAGVRNLLETSGQFCVVGEACNGREALGILACGVCPDIILADIDIPQMNGIELAGRLKEEEPYQNIKLVLLTMMDNENYLFESFRLGISGYLLKDTSCEELLFALSHIYHQNNQYVSSDLAVRLLKITSGRTTFNHSDVDFSKREMDVLTLIGQGFTNKEIADKLFTSRRTVEGHRQALINKANVKNSAELIRFAARRKLID